MDLNKKIYLAQVSLVSEKPEKRETSCIFCFFFLMDFTCVNVWTINLSFFIIVVDVPGRGQASLLFSGVCVNETAVMQTLGEARVHPLKTSNVNNEKQSAHNTHKNNLFCWWLETTAQENVFSFSRGTMYIYCYTGRGPTVITGFHKNLYDTANILLNARKCITLY